MVFTWAAVCADKTWGFCYYRKEGSIQNNWQILPQVGPGLTLEDTAQMPQADFYLPPHLLSTESVPDAACMLVGLGNKHILVVPSSLCSTSVLNL